MNVILKTGFAAALFAICLLGLSAMTAEPSSAWQTCPANECTPGQTDNMILSGSCELYVAGSPWGSCNVYSSDNPGPIRTTCYCDCNY